MRAHILIPSRFAGWLAGTFLVAGLVVHAGPKGAPVKVAKDAGSVVNSQVVISGDVTGVETNPAAVQGNGKVVKRALPVAEAFTGIELNGIFEVDVVCGKPAAVELSVDENLQPLATASVRNGVLRVEFSKSIQTKQSPRLKIALPALASLGLSGNETARVTELKGGEFKLDQAGTGAVTVSGKVGKLTCAVSGVGEVDAGKLTCDTATVVVSGVGNVVCRPEKKLKATLSGVGGVRCLTRPAVVEKEANGVGDVEFSGE